MIQSLFTIGTKGSLSSFLISPKDIIFESLLTVSAISHIAIAPFAISSRLLFAPSTIFGSPQLNAASITSAISDIFVASESFSPNTNATASTIVSPFNTLSTICISASGVHCSIQFSAHVALS